MKRYLLIILFMVPALAGFFMAGDRIYSSVHPPDGNNYLSMMQQAKEGRILLTNMYTPEDVPSLLFRPVFTLAGWVSGLTGLSDQIVYQLFRMAGIGLIIFYLTRLGRLFFKGRHEHLYLYIAIFGSGIGWLFILLSTFGVKHYGSVDQWITEANNLLIFLSHPHTLFSLAFMIAGAYHFMKSYENRQLKDYLISAAFLFIVGIEHLFDVITIGSAVAILLLDDLIITRKLDWQRIRHLIVWGTIIVIPFIYTYALFNVPSYSEWNDQNELDTPPIHQVIFGYGIMAGASALAFIHLARNGYSKVRPEIKLMIYWIIATLILIYSPLNVQRRFLEGLHVPMAVMTGIFIFSVLPHYIKDRRLASGLLIIMILFLPLTNIYLFHKRTVAQDTGRGSFPYNVPAYLEQGEDEALRWIAEKTSPGEVILSGYNIGNYIPAYANRRVFLGHWAQTIRFYERAEMVDSFYKTGDLSLIDHEIDYIYYGVDEKALNPSLSLPGEEVFHNDLVQIYKVR